MSTLLWWLRLMALVVVGGVVALLVQHWTDGRPWPDAGMSAGALVAAAVVIALFSRRTHRDH